MTISPIRKSAALKIAAIGRSRFSLASILSGASSPIAFPLISLKSAARCVTRLRHHLGSRRNHASVAPSIGGVSMVTYRACGRGGGSSRGRVYVDRTADFAAYGVYL